LRAVTDFVEELQAQRPGIGDGIAHPADQLQ
jgi:hypothetical protein